MDCASAGIRDGPATGGSGDRTAREPAGGTDDLDSPMVNGGMLVGVDDTRLSLATGEPSAVSPNASPPVWAPIQDTSGVNTLLVTVRANALMDGPGAVMGGGLNAGGGVDAGV